MWCDEGDAIEAMTIKMNYSCLSIKDMFMKFNFKIDV